MLEISGQQASAMGGCIPCQRSAPPPAPPMDAGPSVRILDPAKPAWVAIELLDARGDPIGGVPYRLALPDGTTVTGNLDQRGRARIEGVDPGQCEVAFPSLPARRRA